MIIVPAQSIPGNQHRWGRPVLRVLLLNSRSSFRSSTNWRRTTKNLGGESLKTLNQDEVRKRCALVSQNGYFFNTRIRQNLRLAHPSASEEEMESAAHRADP